MSDRADDTSRILSLAAMARALGLSVRLEQMLELASEEALKALNASSVSISCLRPGTGAVTINGRAFDSYFPTATQRMMAMRSSRPVRSTPISLRSTRGRRTA